MSACVTSPLSGAVTSVMASCWPFGRTPGARTMALLALAGGASDGRWLWQGVERVWFRVPGKAGKAGQALVVDWQVLMDTCPYVQR